jgi:hypothetical protein
MPAISNDQRAFTINGKQHNIPNDISFKDNCQIDFNQNQADTLCKDILNIIHILDQFCPGEYWAVGGTLLGTIRWNTILPWDDDCDFGVTMKGYEMLLENLSNITTYEFIVTIPGMKIYLGDRCIGDIFVCDTKKGEKHLVYSGPVYDGISSFVMYDYIFHQIRFKQSDVFPLIRKPFGNTTIPCPGNYMKILHNNYKPGVLNTIITPPVSNSHAMIPKTFFIVMYKYAKLHTIGPETAKILCSIFGLVMNLNMSPFMNNNSFSIMNDINFIRLLEEQSKDEVQSHQYECMRVLMEGALKSWKVL